ncbi:hypothetical protein [Dietzia alimentaria]|uniref:hypothetical protein n=1 Tax=Dietzia alimentaria TaxID=665550 RepID=UPI00029B4257|nr:hypothetical protein [Dietzia alimentaria]
MIIHPPEAVAVSEADTLTGLNRTPTAGDPGHVEDHARLVKAIFGVPHVGIPYANYARTGGSWTRKELGPGATAEPTDFGEVSFMESRGLMAIAQSPHAAADGETDYQQDAEALDGIDLILYPVGLAGLATVIGTVKAALDEAAP